MSDNIFSDLEIINNGPITTHAFNRELLRRGIIYLANFLIFKVID